MDQYLLDKLERIERIKAVDQLKKERGNRPLHKSLIPQINISSQPLIRDKNS